MSLWATYPAVAGVAAVFLAVGLSGFRNRVLASQAARARPGSEK